MRVLVDTSVWVDFLNNHPSREAELLARLIRDEVDIVTCGVVVAELFQGFRRGTALQALEGYFREMDWLSPDEPETYLAAAALFRGLRRQGIIVRSTIDCLIARLAEEKDVLVLARDRDMAHIFESGLCDTRGVPI